MTPRRQTSGFSPKQKNSNPFKGLLGKFWPIKSQQPGWVDKYSKGTDWAAVRNPGLQDIKERRNAKIKLWLLMSAVPISVMSCTIALLGSDQSAPVVLAPQEPSGKAIAEKAIAKWVTDSGFQPSQIVWEQWRGTAMPCGNTRCEIHTFLALISNGVISEQVRLELTLNPVTGAVSGISMTAAEDSAGDTTNSSAWSDTYVAAGVLPADFGSTREEWAQAWAANDQPKLRRIANTPGVHPALNLPGWEYRPRSAVTVGQPVGGPEIFYVTTDLTLIPEPPEECQTPQPGLPVPQHCGSSLTLRMNLTVISQEGLVYIQGAAPVGDLKVSDIPESTESSTGTQSQNGTDTGTKTGNNPEVSENNNNSETSEQELEIEVEAETETNNVEPASDGRTNPNNSESLTPENTTTTTTTTVSPPATTTVPSDNNTVCEQDFEFDPLLGECSEVGD